MRPIQRPRRWAALFVALGLAVSTATTATAQAPSPNDRFTATPLTPSGTIVGDFSKAARTSDGRVPVIVQLADDAVASYDGGIAGLAATSPRARGAKTLDMRASATKSYQKYLKGKQDAVSARLSRIRGATATGRFDLALNAVTALVQPDDLAAVAALPGVLAVMPDIPQQPQTSVSPEFIGAPTVWEDLGGQASAGEGVIVGVLDTGIWPEHPSFSDPDPSGKPYASPPPPLSGTRACEFTGGANPGPAFACNDKLIGGDRFMATYDAVIGLLPTEYTTARDDNGHGTHTASTAAGNGGVATTIFGNPRGTISGVAPRAHVISYKVCGDQGCFPSDTVAAIQKAITDGVNTINFSISGGASPFGDAVELSFLGAYNAGVFVSASAGNSGPTAETTDHRGPWTMTVAASTSNRFFHSDLTLTGSNGDTVTVQGVSITNPWAGSVPVATGASLGSDALCVAPLPAGSAVGKVVICDRGPGRILKSRNVLNAGGAGMILMNTFPAFTGADNHWVPTVHVENPGVVQLQAFLASHTGVTASMNLSTPRTVKGDTIAFFSSRGGPAQPLGVSKPDITAPGVQILAGNTPTPATVAGGPAGQLFMAILGTSMSSPHVAGSGALLKALHPNWTPGQIKSALMTTASQANVTKEDGVTPATPFDTGSGRVDLTVAGDPGITFSSTGAQFVANQNRLQDANYPSIYYPNFPGVASVNRTAADVLGANTSWNVRTSTSAGDFTISTPKKLNVPANGSATFSVTLDASRIALGQVRHGTIVFEQIGGGRVLHMPVTIVRGQAPISFSKTCAPTDLSPGETTSCTITATNPTFAAATYSIRDKLPPQLKLDPTSVVGGTVSGKDTVLASGTLPASQPPNVAIAPGTSPAGGYLPLSGFGIPPIGGVGDDTITNFNVPPFLFGGESWSQVGVSSNGYVVIGGGSGPDNTINNQNFPNPLRPNNTLALFWTDLNPAAAGAVRIGTLTDGPNTWLVIDWQAVREFSTAGNLHSFQAWIGVSGDASPAEDVSYAYGANTGNGDGGFTSVGAENKFGNRGQNTYFNGTGTLPSNGTQLRVTTTPGAVSSVTVSFDAVAGDNLDPWTNCATLQSSAFVGTSYSCVSGTIE